LLLERYYEHQARLNQTKAVSRVNN
jgi:hypothetical protein